MESNPPFADRSEAARSRPSFAALRRGRHVGKGWSDSDIKKQFPISNNRLLETNIRFDAFLGSPLLLGPRQSDIFPQKYVT